MTEEVEENGLANLRIVDSEEYQIGDIVIARPKDTIDIARIVVGRVSFAPIYKKPQLRIDILDGNYRYPRQAILFLDAYDVKILRLS